MDVLLNTKKEVELFSGISSNLELNSITAKNSVFDAFDFFLESAITNSLKNNQYDIDYLLYDDDEVEVEDDDDDEVEDWEEDEEWDDEEWDEEFEWDEEEEWDDDEWDDNDDEDEDDEDDDDWDDEPNAGIFNLKDFTIN